MTTENTANTGREMHLEGTDLLRMVGYACDGNTADYFGEFVVPTLGQYSEIELWALAGIFLNTAEDNARFIAHYARCVLEQTQHRGEAIVGYEKPTAYHPNPDPVPIRQKWLALEAQRAAYDEPSPF
jgi:hypothetical protein